MMFNPAPQPASERQKGAAAAHMLIARAALIADVIRRRHGAVASVGDVIRAIPQEARP